MDLPVPNGYARCGREIGILRRFNVRSGAASKEKRHLAFQHRLEVHLSYP